VVEADRLTGSRVLVVGDVMLDRYWFGDVSRISPEAPVPVVSVQADDERPGGAANVACGVAALGARCRLISVVGRDDAGEALGRLLRDHGVAATLAPDPEGRTTVKLRVLSRNQQLLRLDFEGPPSREILDRCWADFQAALPEADVVVFSDYDKGGLAHMERMVALAREAGVQVLVDPKGRDFERYRGATYVTPNLGELRQVVGPWSSEEELEARAAGLAEALELEGVLVTRSAEGMSLFRRDGGVTHSPARAREVFDVTGAGDTVVAVLAATLAAGAPVEEAMRWANAAAGIAVGRLGTAAPGLDEIEAALADTRPG